MQRINNSSARHILTALVATSLYASSAPFALAATGTSVFTGTVLSTCVIGPVGTPGIMTASTDLKKLSSKNGLPAAASTMALITTGGVTVKVDPNVSVVSVPSDPDAITWTPSFAISGTHTFLDGIVDRVLGTAGVDTVTVNLEGEKSGNNVFKVGVYTATVTLTCEPSG